MRRIRSALCTLLSATTLLLSTPPPLFAQSAPSAPSDFNASFAQARELIKSADYDGAIKILKATIQRVPNQTGQLREAYLLMINAYVQLGKRQRSQPQGYEASQLAYKEAKERIIECLRIKELRHTRPEREKDYPLEMINLFAEVRAEIFGAFQVVSLEPAGSTVILDGDTLRAQADGRLGDVDVEIGRHNVLIQHEGYQTRNDAITITPGSTLEQPYKLVKKRGRIWYATRGGAALGAVAGLVVALSKKHTPSTESPLPGPPNPPSGANH